MVDKKDNGGKDQPPEQKQQGPKRRDQLARFLNITAEQYERKFSRPLARYIVRKFPDPVRNWATVWKEAIPFVSIAIAMITPEGTSRIGEHLDHFQQDLFAAVQEELESPTQRTDADEEVERAAQVAKTREAQYTRICNVLVGWEQKKRDDFFLWSLNLTPEKRERFHNLIAGADDAKLSSYLELPPRELERIINGMPEPSPKKTQKMTPLQLRAAIADDRWLTAEAQGFLMTAHVDEERFWKAVESKIKTIEDFRALIRRDNDSVVRRLGLDKKSLTERLDSWAMSAGKDVKESGLVDWSKRLKDKTKEWSAPKIQEGGKS